MEKLCSTDVVQKSREAGRAWRLFIAFITDNVRCGFEEEVRVVSRYNSYVIYQLTSHDTDTRQLSRVHLTNLHITLEIG